MSFSRIPRKKVPSMAALQCFEASARYLSFTQAGEELYLSQSAVSKQVAQLEMTLQTTLFYRVRKRLRLSTAGQMYLPEVRKILGVVEESTLHMLSYESDREILSLAAHPTFGARWLIPALKGFYDLYPNIHLNLKDYVQPFDLAKAGIDVAFLFGSGIWEGLETIKLFDELMIPVCQPQFLSNHTKQLTNVEEFQNYILLQCQSRSASWYLYFSSQNVEIDRCYQGPGFETWSACIQAAEMGYGIALVPKFLVQDELIRGSLIIPWHYELASHGAYYLAYEAQSADIPRIKKLVDWTKRHLSNQILEESEKKE